MAGFNDNIDELYGLAKMQQDHDRVLSLIKEYIKNVDEAGGHIIDLSKALNIAGLGEFQKIITEINKNISNNEGAKSAITALKGRVDELTLAMGAYKTQSDALARTNASLAAGTSQQAQELANLRVQLREQNRELTNNANANNTSVQARNANAQAARDQAAADKELAAQERELNRLIALEERATIVAQRKAEAQASREKAAADREYARIYEQLLNDRDREIAQGQKLAAAAQAQAAERSRAAAVNAVAIDSLVALRRTLSDAQYGYDRLTASERANAEIGGVRLARIREINAELMREEALTGRFQRNVGNYNAATAGINRQLQQSRAAFNGLNYSITTLVSEIPNAGISLKVFAQSLSNNILPFTIALQNARLENERLIASGAKGIPIYKQIGKALFSVQTAVVLGVVVGLKLVDMFNKGSKAAQEAEKANKKYAESINSINENARSAAITEISHLQALNKVATDTTISLQARKAAAEEMQKLYPDRFANLTTEAILEGQAADKINLATASILARARATASEKKLAASSEREYDLGESLGTARENLNDYLKFLDKNVLEVGRKRKELGRALTIPETYQAIKEADMTDNEGGGSFTGELEKRVRDYNKIRSQLSKAAAESKKYADEINAFTKAATVGAQGPADGTVAALRVELEDIKGKVERAKRGSEELKKLIARRKEIQKELDSIDNKDPKSKAPADQTKAELAADQAVLKSKNDIAIAGFQIEADNQKAIADNEQQSLADRLNAYDLYQQAKQNINAAELNKEIEVLAAALDKIKEIEGIAAKDRTKQEKDILLHKEQYLEQFNLAVAEAKQKENAIILQGAKDRNTIETSVAQRFIQEENKITLFYSAQQKLQLADLQDRYRKGTITQKKYNQEVRELQEATSRASLNTSIEFLEAIQAQFAVGSAAYKLVGDEIDKLQTKINGLKSTAKGGSYLSSFLGIDQDELQKAISDLQLYEQSALSVASSIKQAFANASDARVDGYEKEIDLIGKKKDADLLAIELAGLSAQDLAAKKATIEATAAAKTADLQNKEKQEKRKQAAADKAYNIMRIIGETALAVVHQLSSGDPYTAIGRAIAVGAVGAVELAVAASARLPQYADGIAATPRDEYALTGEGKSKGRYVPEIIEEPGKPARIVTKPTIGFLKKNTRVTPVTQLTQADIYRLIFPTVSGTQQQQKSSDMTIKDLAMTYERMTNRTIREIRANKPVQTIIINDKGYMHKHLN